MPFAGRFLLFSGTDRELVSFKVLGGFHEVLESKSIFINYLVLWPWYNIRLCIVFILWVWIFLNFIKEIVRCSLTRCVYIYPGLAEEFWDLKFAQAPGQGEGIGLSNDSFPKASPSPLITPVVTWRGYWGTQEGGHGDAANSACPLVSGLWISSSRFSYLDWLQFRGILINSH